MMSKSLKVAAALAAIFAAPLFVSSTGVAAQQTPSNPPASGSAPAANTQPGQSAAPASGALPNAAPAAAPTIDPAEEADYKAFVAIPATDADKRITAGEAFAAKYPNGTLHAFGVGDADAGGIFQAGRAEGGSRRRKGDCRESG